MKLTIKFNSLWDQVRRLTDAVDNFDLHSYIKEIDPIDLQLGEGLEVALDDLGDVGGLFEYKGRQVLLYIPDHGRSVENVLSGNHEGKKFHLCDCRTLNDMRSQGRFNRYFATTDLSGMFTITGDSYDRTRQVEGKSSLYVCMNCLKKLNYREAAISGKLREVRKTFNIQDFFETYSSCFPHLPKQKISPTDKSAYVKDWPEISAKKRASVNYVCEECRVDLSNNKKLLHVHHVDGQKGNNTDTNLRALCADCHRKQPMHSSMFVTHQDMMTITKLRGKQSIINSGWSDALKYVDPALKGALSILKNKGWPAPEIGYEILDEQGVIISELEAAWETQRKGIYIRDVDENILPSWNLYSLAEIIKNQ